LEAAAERSPLEVLVPQRTFGNDLRAIKIVWQRDIIRFWADKPRIFASLGQPFLYMFVLGTGLSSMIPPEGGIWLPTFLFPGVLALSVMFTCFLSAGSLVTDREFGFMRVMLVAPVRRSAIVLGKCLGGATVGALQGSLVIAIGGIVRVPYDPELIVTLLAELVLLSFALTALGVLLAVHIRRMQSYLAIMQLSASPMYFFSGALFRVDRLPKWLATANRLDPLSYAVDPMRRAVLGHLGIPVPGLTWGTFHVPVIVELGLVATLALVALALATVQFQRTE
jgi:ABC-2 type transport system permease protein